MPMAAETLSYILALGTVALQAAIGALLIIYIMRKHPGFADLSELISRWGMWLALAASPVVSALTLFYSEVLGFPPRPFCWLQRMFLYPQVVLFSLALWKKDRLPAPQGTLRQTGSVADYSIAMSVIGFGVALYHHTLQVLPAGSLPCPAEGAVSCAQRFIFEFGYITLPLMAATLFA